MQPLEAILEQAEVARPGELRAYHGGYFRVLVAPSQTQNALAVVEFTQPQGDEPPRHLHTREDEVFHVLEGTVDFHVGDEVIHAKAGDTAFAPRNVAHQYIITSPQARLLIMITPGDFTGFFVSQSEPLAAERPLRPAQGPPPAAAIEQLTILLREEYGVLFSA